jgi:hypothetical protein
MLAAEGIDEEEAVADFKRWRSPELLTKKGAKPQPGLALLDQISTIVQPVERSLYIEYEQLARKRVELRDEDDWPVAAVAAIEAVGGLHVSKISKSPSCPVHGPEPWVGT